jgi:sodium/hydrogen antiporter
MKMSHKRGFNNREAYVTQYIALTFFTIGIASSIGSDDLLAAFAAGCAMSWDGDFNERNRDESLPTVIDFVFNCACFMYIGAWMPFNSFTAYDLGITPWRLVALFVLVLFLRRIPLLLMIYTWVPEIDTWRHALFVGHFGKVFSTPVKR